MTLNMANLTLKKTLSNQIRKLKEQKRKLDRKICLLTIEIKQTEQLLNKIERE